MAEMNRWERWLVNRRTERRARRVLARLEPVLRVPAGSRVLELGAGSGGLIALLSERFHPVRLVGTDYDARQVTAARAFLSGRWGTIPATVELQQADALTLPFPDASFDLVFAMLMLHHVETRVRRYERRPQALREVRRVLRPGGALVYSEIFARKAIRTTLNELGFTDEFRRSGWRSDLAIVRSPAPAPTVPS